MTLYIDTLHCYNKFTANNEQLCEMTKTKKNNNNTCHNNCLKCFVIMFQLNYSTAFFRFKIYINKRSLLFFSLVKQTKFWLTEKEKKKENILISLVHSQQCAPHKWFHIYYVGMLSNCKERDDMMASFSKIW